MSILERFRFLNSSPRAGLLALAIGVGATLIWVQILGGTSTIRNLWPYGSTTQHITIDPATGVKLNATLSQPKIVQGSDGTVYLDLKIVTPGDPERRESILPTDILVVLDRSGSMSDGNKWQYATQAVQSLLDRLTPSDRIALISFDSSARLDSPLARATPQNIARIRNVLQRLAPGASTNLGDALLLAERTTGSLSEGARTRRVMVLSDGHANTGIVEPAQLQKIARRLADSGSIVSTVGMGLGFNETLMASLADQGMGSFSYLEHLESLGSMLAAELSDTRRVFAEGSEVKLSLPRGTRIVDVAGYPFEMNGTTAVIRTGQLLRGSTKGFIATLRIPSQSTGNHEFGAIDLFYRSGGRSHQQTMAGGNLLIACVAPERKAEVVASIDRTVYREAWIENNFGALMKKVGDFVRSGEKSKASGLIESYKNRLEEAAQSAPEIAREADVELKELEARVDDAFDGPNQGLKQNRAAKQFLDEAQKRQRTLVKQ